ncbi:MAG: hypothetical protein HC828_07440 [Blastochloris sp.]|nr:hypothetical protein [Blastochloris sp.]
MRRYDEGLLVLNSALEAGKESHNPLLLAQVRSNLAVSHYQLGEANQARNQLLLGLADLNQDNRGRQTACDIRMVLSHIYRSEGEPGLAIKEAEQALVIAVELQDRKKIVQLIDILARGYEDSGQLQEGIAALDQIRNQLVNLPVALATLDMRQALLAWTGGNYEQALGVIERLPETTLEQLGTTLAERSTNLYLMGALRSRRGELIQAAKIYEKLLPMVQQLGDTSAEIESCSHWRRSAFGAGTTDKLRT